MPLRAFSLLIAAAMAAAPSPASACDCGAPEPTAKEAMKTAAVVFEGTLRASRRVAERMMELELEVHHVWKGDVAATARVYSVASNCGYGRFALGTKMLLYAPDRGGRLEVGECVPGHRGVFGDEIGREVLVLGPPTHSFLDPAGSADAGSQPPAIPREAVKAGTPSPAPVSATKPSRSE